MATATTTTTTTNATTDSNNVTNDGRKPLVKDLHEHIVCPLCRGYLIDATTLVECLHSFCRGCIVRRLGSGARACPVCGALTLPPLLPDLALQRLVYMAVPGLYRSELERRRHFRMVNPQCPPPAPPLGALSLTIEDAVSLSLCEILDDDDDDEEPRDRLTGLREDLETTNTSGKKNTNQVQLSRTRGGREEFVQDEENRSSSSKRLIRYLKCPAGVTVRHLVRLLALKRGWGDTDGKFTLKHIEMLYQSNTSNDLQTDEFGTTKNGRLHRLQLSWNLLDLACIFKWDKETPMKLFYRVVKREEPKLLQSPPVITYNAIGTGNNNNNNNNNNNSSIATGNSTNNMENVQRPPTPPPSPKQSSNSDVRTQPHQTTAACSKPKSQSDEPTQASQPAVSGSLKEAENDDKLLQESSSTIETEKSSTSSTSSCSNQTKAAPPDVQSAIIDPQNTANSSERENYNGVKVKKPRCEVTPVMRAPGFHGSCTPTVTGVVDQINAKAKVPRIEHHKRRKRRNKRLIAEITTTPREDLLKLKVRLTPCPPRITSNTGGSAKEKLLQMRAVRREKIKSSNDRVQTPPPIHSVAVKEPIGDSNSPEMPLTPPPSASAEVVSPVPIIKAGKTENDILTSKTTRVKEVRIATGPDVQEETIEDIIDGIPDEVVRVAQNLNAVVSGNGGDIEKPKKLEIRKPGDKEQFVEVKTTGNGKKKRIAPVPEVHIISDEDEFDDLELEPEDDDDDKRQNLLAVNNKPHKKDEEVLRRLGLVAISEASKTLQDKIRGSQKSGGSGGTGIDYNRESLERQLRESKANRVRSLLAEKQMRDALKSIMSKSKGGGGGGGVRGGSTNGPKKGPPPLAPLTPKQGFPNPPKTSHPQTTAARSSVSGGNGKIEKPLDLSSGANNALDLSPATPSSSVNPPVITSTTFTTPVVKSRVKLTCGGSGSGGIGSGDGSKVKLSSSDEKKNNNQDNLNLRTLSDAAVSLLGSNTVTCQNNAAAVVAAAAAATGEVRINNSPSVLSNKVALRIPQYHNRISGFGNGVKIKQNSAVRYIPNPQAFVASQYVRNQRTTFFNAQQQQPP